MRFVTVPVIRTDEDHDFVSRRLITILTPSSKVLKKDPDQVRSMAILSHHYAMSKNPGRSFPDPVSAIKFRMEHMGLTPADLIPLLGSQSVVSRVLSRRRTLTLPMIRRIRKHLEVPADDLIRPVRNWNKKGAV